MSEDNDETLLVAIATRRDPGAFSSLLARHERTAYNVAFHICGSRELGEEAVQEAMLRIWMKSDSFQPGGNARSWLLRIVARESLRLVARRMKNSRRERQQMDIEIPVTGPQTDGVEKNELTLALRELLEGLPSIDRQMLALHFGAGLTQEEVGKSLALSQRVVSYKLKDVLERLRTELAHNGYAAAVPLVSVEGLRQVISSGARVPSGLHQRVIDNTLRVKANAGRGDNSSRRSVHRSTRTPLIAGAGIAVALGTGALLYSLKSTPPQPATQNVSVTSTPAAPAPLAADVYGHWTFENGAPADLTAIQGSWTWEKGAGTARGRMIPSPELPLLAMLPQTIPDKPYVLTISFQVFAGQKASMDVFWSDQRHLMGFTQWSMPADNSESHSAVHYLIGNYAVLLRDGKPFQVQKFERSVAARRLCLLFENVGIEEIELRAARPGEIPPELSEPGKFIESMKAAPISVPERPLPQR
jgi:RNA polymerase sigma-70 factor (ECF subfamily)